MMTGVFNGDVMTSIKDSLLLDHTVGNRFDIKSQ